MSGSKHSQTTFEILCDGPCKEVKVKLKAGTGDPDLYGKEGSPPIITGSECNNCPDCKSRAGSGSEDKCTFTIGNIYLK